VIPDPWFVRELKLIDDGLLVRWEVWKPDEPDMTVAVWPMQGNAFRTQKELLPSDGRFVVYGLSRRYGTHYPIFDVVDAGGHPQPLNRFVLERLNVRDDQKHNIYERLHDLTMAAMLADRAKVREEHRNKEAEGALADSLEAYFREETGLTQHAIGTPGTPAATRVGDFVVTDKRRFAKYAE
jgi:hypothetical protein